GTAPTAAKQTSNKAAELGRILEASSSLISGEPGESSSVNDVEPRLVAQLTPDSRDFPLRWCLCGAHLVQQTKKGPISGATIQKRRGMEGNVREGDARRRSKRNGRSRDVENCGEE